MVEVKTYTCIVACMIGVGYGQLTFPGASTADAGSSSSSSSVPSQRPADQPQGHPGQTRLFGLDGLLGAVFGDECDRCSVRDQVLANRCCQQGKRHCCQFLQPVVGFVRPPPGGSAFGRPPPVGPGFGRPPPVGPGFVQPGGFQPGGGSFQPGPPGFLPPGGGSSGLISGTGLSGGDKQGVCPDGSRGVQSGFNRFVGAQCVQQCRADVQCPGIQKCCNVGCSSACQSPRGVGVQGFPGSNFQTGGGFIPGGGAGGFIPGGGAGGFIPGGGGGFIPGGGAGGFPVGGGFGGGGFGQPTTKAGFCPRKINPITDPLGAVGSLLGLRSGAVSADDPNATSDTTGTDRSSEKTGKVARRDARRQARQEERQNSRSKRQSGNEQPQSDGPNTRFFGPFCRDRCFNDFDCPGNLKCCTGQLDDCQQCVNPQFF